MAIKQQTSKHQKGNLEEKSIGVYTMFFLLPSLRSRQFESAL